MINNLIPQKREFGIVFQSYALFPNMTVEENIAFGLKVRKMPKKAIEERVDQMLDLIGLRDWRKLYPPQLSGGQQQRVALVRALAPNPQVLLLDEPLSALDAKIRVRLRAEVKRLQQELKKTMIYVTHDQEEALSIADRVVVMEKGQFRQVGKPIDIYRYPNSSFVADFVGTSNFFKGERTEDRVEPERGVSRSGKRAPLRRRRSFSPSGRRRSRSLMRASLPRISSLPTSFRAESMWSPSWAQPFASSLIWMEKRSSRM